MIDRLDNVIYAVLGSAEGSYFYNRESLIDKRYQLSYAGGKSGYSFGFVQLDVVTNGKALPLFVKLLSQAVEARRITNTEAITYISEAGKAASKNYDTLTELDKNKINELVLLPGKALIDAESKSQINFVKTSINNLISSAKIAWGEDFSQSVLSENNPDYEKAIGLLASWSNRTHGLTSADSYLSGNSNSTDEYSDQLKAPPTYQNLVDYLHHQKQFVDHPNEWSNWIGNVSRGLNSSNFTRCFLAGTPILMSDGSEKPIEEIEIGDEVMAFDPLADQGKGQRTSKKVTRLFRNVTNKILDLHGLKMTPGHVVLTDQGEWLTIARVLKADRAIVKEVDGKPVEIRARTGRPIGSAEDIPINVVFRDPVTRRQQVATVRAGIPAIAHTYAGKTELWTLGKVLAHQNYRLEADGTIFDASDNKFDATPWPGSTPFESEIMHNWVISVDGRSYTPQWIVDLPLEDEKNASTAGAVQDGASYASPKTMNRHERRRMAALRVVK